jgi:hypothetical protein
LKIIISHIIKLSCIILLTNGTVWAQKVNKLVVNVDTTWLNSPLELSGSSTITSSSNDYTIEHNPTKEDTQFYNTYVHLIYDQPTAKNYQIYYKMACTLWELGKIREAEHMFQKIVHSKESFYELTYWHNSDIPNDTLKNMYGYGSYTSNYKNYACRYLAMIYIEQEEFHKANQYVTLAQNHYKVEHNCGTGYKFYQRELEGLYALSYQGLGQYDSIINMMLPHYYDFSEGILTRAIKNKYTQYEIQSHLAKAINSIVFEYESITELNYYSTTVSTVLFDKKVNLLVNNENVMEEVTKEDVITQFQNSNFYKALLKVN